MMGFLTLHPRAFGLDLSDLSLKVAQLEKKRQGFRLVSYGGGELAEGVIEGGEIKDEEKLAASIQKALKQVKGKKIHTRYVVAALPEERAFVQVIQIPRMKREEMMVAVRFQAENFIPYPIALTRAVVGKGVSPIPILLVDVGKVRTKLSIFSGYSVRFTTSLSLSSQQFTEAVARTLHVDEEKAEEFKRQYGLYVPEDALGQEVFRAIVPVANDFIEQISKYLEYYETHLPHQHLGKSQTTIKKVMLCGGGANLKGFPEFLMRSLKVEVVIGDPWVNILPRNAQELPLLPFQESLSYSCALGLALRGAQRGKSYD